MHRDRKIDTIIKFKVGKIHAEVDVFFSLTTITPEMFFLFLSHCIT